MSLAARQQTLERLVQEQQTLTAQLGERQALLETLTRERDEAVAHLKTFEATDATRGDEMAQLRQTLTDRAQRIDTLQREQATVERPARGSAAGVAAAQAGQ